MSPILIKSFIAAGGLSLGGIGIWQLNEYMAPKTLQQQMERNGESFHSMVEGQDIEGWKVLAKKYGEGSSGNTSNRFGNLTIPNSTQQGDQDAKSLQAECRKIAQKGLGGSDQESDMVKLRSWCIKPKTSQGN